MINNRGKLLKKNYKIRNNILFKSMINYKFKKKNNLFLINL